MHYLLLSLLLASSTAFASEAPFSLSSQDLHEGELMSKAQEFSGFGCQGENRSPALRWQHPPKGTRSFAVTAYDPDAPTGSGWWHWLVINLPAATLDLPAGAGSGGPLPPGALQTRTDYGSPGFGGACPPAGSPAHRYIFTVWALKTDKLELDSNASGALVGFMLNSNVLGKASITTRYGR